MCLHVVTTMFKVGQHLSLGRLKTVRVCLHASMIKAWKNRLQCPTGTHRYENFSRHAFFTYTDFSETIHRIFSSTAVLITGAVSSGNICTGFTVETTEQGYSTPGSPNATSACSREIVAFCSTRLPYPRKMSIVCVSI